MEYKTAFGTITTSTNSETDVSKKEEFNNMKTLKFEAMIKEINELISYNVFKNISLGISISNGLKMAKLLNREPVNFSLSLIHNYNNLNEYAKIILKLTTNTNNEWCKQLDETIVSETGKSATYDYFIDHKNRLNAAKSFISSYSSGESRVKYEFVFWNLMVLAVDKTDFEEKMSLICDFARMLKVTDDEVEDIIQVIKIIFREINAEESTFKTDNIPDMFGRVINMYENKNTCAQKG